MVLHTEYCCYYSVGDSSGEFYASMIAETVSGDVDRLDVSVEQSPEM